MLKTVSSITNAIGALNFKGTWDANANSPVLTSSVGTKGDYYVVGTAGSTNLNGISNWGVGDWAAFNGSVWQRVEGGANLNGVDLSVSGTSTLSGLTASTALALNASKEIVSVTNTGTGNNVLATSPTLTTPNIGAATATSLTTSNATTGVSVSNNAIAATGSDTNINVVATPKGSGGLSVGRTDNDSFKLAVRGNTHLSSGTYSLPAGVPVTITEGYGVSGTNGRELFRYGRGVYYAGGNNTTDLTMCFTPNEGDAPNNGGMYMNTFRPLSGDGSTTAWSVGRINHVVGGPATLTERFVVQHGGTVRPAADNTQLLGSASFKWSEVWAGNGTIQTSDARLKTSVATFTANEMAAAKALAKEIGTFKFLASIESKGDKARAHIGLTVQRVMEIMQSNDLNPFDYGFVCYDKWEEEFITRSALHEVKHHDEVLDDKGNIIEEAWDEVTDVVITPAWNEKVRDAGDLYSLRYDQVLLFIAKGFEERLSALEGA
jgi:hypothetical protein